MNVEKLSIGRGGDKAVVERILVRKMGGLREQDVA